jgi:hypothetical protein
VTLKTVCGLFTTTTLNIVCQNNVVPLVSPGRFDCDDATIFFFGEFIDPNTEMPVPLNNINYFNADAVGCQGCDRLKNNVCQ